MIYATPGSAGAPVNFKAQYDNFIGGKFVAPVKGAYFDVIPHHGPALHQGSPLRR